MSFHISPIGNDQFFDSNGNLLVGGKLFTYQAGTTTKIAVYKDNLGAASHTNPIILNVDGMPPDPIFLIGDIGYKFVLAPASDTDPPSSPIYTWDNVMVSSIDSSVLSQWTLGTVPIYVAVNQFSVVGDQTSTYQIGRRVKLTSTISTFYGVIIGVAFTSVTTVTVILDSSVLDASLFEVSYSILTGSNTAIPNMRHSGNDTFIIGNDARTSTVDASLTVGSQTTGSPAAGIGTGILIQAESADEVPSDFGQLEFAASDVGAGTEDTYFQILLRVAGAVLSAAYRFVATSVFRAIFTHANTADRTYYFPNRDLCFGIADDGPSSTGSGSTAAHEGTVTIAADQALSGVHFYTNFTLNSTKTLTVADDAGRLCIFATGTITINGTIDAIGAGGQGGPSNGGGTQDGMNGADGTSQPGGGGGGGSAGKGGDGGHGGHAHGGRGGVINGAGAQGTNNTGERIGIANPLNIYGGGGGGAGGNGGSGVNGAGGNGGGSVILVAPNVVLGASSVINTSGTNAGSGAAFHGGGGGGGSAGNFYVFCRSYTDNGVTHTATAGTAGGGVGTGAAGANGHGGVKQILIYT